MRHAPDHVRADDVTLGIDAHGGGGGGARKVNGGEAPVLVEQEPMRDAPSRVLADDVTTRAIAWAWVDEAPGKSKMVKVPS